MKPLRTRIGMLVVIAVVLATGTVGVAALSSEPGHAPLHIGCKNHNHGPARTAGEGKRLLDARALNRQARQLRP